MRKVQWHSIFLCRKNKIKKFLLFFSFSFFLLFCSRQPIRKWYIHWLSSSHWQKALNSRLGSARTCTYGLFFFSYLDAARTVFAPQDNRVSARHLTQSEEWDNVLMWVQTNTTQLLATANWSKFAKEFRQNQQLSALKIYQMHMKGGLQLHCQGFLNSESDWSELSWSSSTLLL